MCWTGCAILCCAQHSVTVQFPQSTTETDRPDREASERMPGEVDSDGEDSAEDRDYKRLLGKSATKGSARKAASASQQSPLPKAKSGGGAISTDKVANGSTPLSSVKAALDDLSDDEGGARTLTSFQPGAPGYIEPGSTPDKSVHDKIRLFHQRSATGQPHNHKELFGVGGAGKKAKEGLAGDWPKRPSDDKQDDGANKPPKPRQVEALVRQSRAEAGIVRKRGVRDVKSRGKSPDVKDPATTGSDAPAAKEASVAETPPPAAPHPSQMEHVGPGAERIVASPRPPNWMCRVVVTAVEARDVPRMKGEVMTDCACRITFNAPGALAVSSCTKYVRSSGHDKGVKWKERMVFGLPEELAPSASLHVELVGRSVSNSTKQSTFGHVRELRVSELLNQVPPLYISHVSLRCPSPFSTLASTPLSSLPSFPFHDAQVTHTHTNTNKHTHTHRHGWRDGLKSRMKRANLLAPLLYVSL